MRLGYRCQSDEEFMQYLERDIYKLSPHSVLRFLHELPDTEYDVQLKVQMLHKLSRVSDYYKYW